MRALSSFSESGARERPPGAGWLWALALGSSLLAFSPRLLAADAEPPAVAAAPGGGADALLQARRMLLERAKARYEAGRGAGEDARPHFEAALDALDLAYRLSPASWLLFNMAQVRSQLGACSEAAALYERFLASEPGPDAKASAEEALRLLGSCEESKREPSMGDGLPPGVRARSSRAGWIAAFGSVVPPSPLPAVRSDAAEESDAARVFPWVFAGLAVTSGLAGAVFYGEARAAKRDLDRLRVAGPLVAETQQRGESAQDLARVFGGLALGFALATGASYWWPRPEPTEARLLAALERLSWLPLEEGAGAAYLFDF